MKYLKPGPKKKANKKPTRASLQLSKGRPCINCGSGHETVVPAHYNGIYKFILGGGVGRKVFDLSTADLCYECHDAFDGRSNRFKHKSKAEISDDFIKCIVWTIQRDFVFGNIILKNDFNIFRCPLTIDTILTLQGFIESGQMEYVK